MLEKTKRFLKKEFGKRTEQNDDCCYAVWKEKSDFTRLLILKYACYLGTFDKEMREVLKNADLASTLTPSSYEPAGSQKLRDRYNEICKKFMNTPLGDMSIKSLEKTNTLLQNDSANIKILKLFTAPKYEPPDKGARLLSQAILIDHYYSYLLPAIGFHSWVVDARIDLALLKITEGIYVQMHKTDSLISKIDQTGPGARKKMKNGQKNKQAIGKVLEKHDITNLSQFRSNKTLRDTFMAEAQQQTSIDQDDRKVNEQLSPKRIYDIARKILKEKAAVLDTEATV